jgi:DNA-binding NarL/FixJ family response regulator
MKANILLIDDEVLFRQEAELTFQNSCYTLFLASNSNEGLNMVKTENVDLVLLDITMPDLSNNQSTRAGIDLLPHIRKIKPNLPVIMITADDSSKSAVESLKLGAIDYINKHSMTDSELLNKISSTICESVYSKIKEGESESVEFKSSMRWNFHQNKFDDYVRSFFLKTIVAFLNTRGGVLLLGVKDDGDILGIEHDKFENRDKYLLYFNNQINDLIGANFSKYIRPRFIEIEEKTIFYVECLKSETPVFLNVNQNEEFFIRVGNSSRKLTMSEMLEYLK